MTSLLMCAVEGTTVGRFQLLSSNNLKAGTGTAVHSVGRTNQGMSFANQIVETEALPSREKLLQMLLKDYLFGVVK